MPFVKNSDEVKKRMESVRNARQHMKQIPQSSPQSIPLSPMLKDVKDTNVEIELPKDKFMLLLNIIMELQRDIDYLIDAHREMKD